MARTHICAMRKWADKLAEDFFIEAKELSLVEKTDNKSNRNGVVVVQAVDAVRRIRHDFDN